MPALVVSRRRRRGIRAAKVRSDGTFLVDRLAPRCELSIALVDDTEMQTLNRDYRHKDRPTDVLAFPMDHPSEPGAILGDVVISLDTAVRQAEAAGIEPAAEVRTLLVHGFLHLLGYDHERSPADARKMFRKQRELIRELAGAR